MARRNRTLLLWLSAAWLAIAPPAGAQDVADWAYRIPHDVMSPFCPGRTLAECPSPQADELRLWIITQAAAGASRAEVEELLYARFGDVIRSAPKAEGWGITAYALPIGGVIAGGAVLAIALRRIVRTPAGGETPAAPASAPPSTDDDGELERWIEDEVRRA